MTIDQPEEADLPHIEWRCDVCGAMNSPIDADCQFCDNTKEPPVTDRDPTQRKVYEFPVKATLEMKLYILAYDHEDAYAELSKVDIQDLFDFNDVTFQTSVDRLTIEDVHTTEPADILDADDAHELSSTEYNPKEHPDWLGVPTK